MTKVHTCGARLRVTGPAVNMKEPTTILSRARRPQVLPFLSPSQVRGSSTLVAFHGTHVLTETGTRAWLCGGILNITNGNGTYISYPTADYKIDGVSGEPPDKNVAL